MTRLLSPRQFAQRLARIAQDIRIRHDDRRAQTIPYALLLQRWEPSIDVEPLLIGFDDPGVLSDIDSVLDTSGIADVRNYYASQGKDPAIYFYEQFIRACDPVNARKRGVMYTPPEVVAFMMRGVSSILHDAFGLALRDACVIDPCCGVGTFLRHIEKQSEIPGQMVGMELMPAACEIARSLLPGSRIIQTDWLVDNCLDMCGRLPVIIGNPPYSGHSSNAGKIADLMAEYRDGIHERNPKWLQDDYVKFIRMAQHHIDRYGRGIVAFITNHSYLFNPTFRAMRRSLMRTFDEILVLDLGGNIKRLDLSNENIFPIQMGIAISFLVKTGEPGAHVIRHAAIEGSKKHKLDTMASAELRDVPWTDLPGTDRFSLFIPHDSDLRDEFYNFPSALDLFREHTIGFVTSRDAFAVGFTRDEVLSRIDDLRSGQVGNDELRSIYRVGDLNIEAARTALRSDTNWEDNAREVLYRPFDRRWVYYSREMMERPRLPFMRNLMRPNIALAIGRAGQVTGSNEWDLVFCTDCPADLNLFRRGGAKLFPRYIYAEGLRQSNMLPHTAINEDTLFGYIYAVLHSAKYRARYADFLRIDYPRIPISEDHNTVARLAELGWQMINVHLMRVTSGPISSASAVLHVGGYELPLKAVHDRRPIATKDEIAALNFAIDCTLNLRSRIDEIMSTSPPWPT